MFSKITSLIGILSVVFLLVMLTNYVTFRAHDSDFSPAFTMSNWKCPAYIEDTVFISVSGLHGSMDERFGGYFRLQDSATLKLVGEHYTSAVVLYDESGVETSPNHWNISNLDTKGYCTIGAQKTIICPFLVEFYGYQECEGFGASFRSYSFYFFGWRNFGRDRGGCS